MFDTTPTFLQKKGRPGVGGWAERHAWKILIGFLVMSFALRGIGIALEVGLIVLVGNVTGLSGIVMCVVGLVLRRKTRKEAEQQSESDG